MRYCACNLTSTAQPHRLASNVSFPIFTNCRSAFLLRIGVTQTDCGAMSTGTISFHRDLIWLDVQRKAWMQSKPFRPNPNIIFYTLMWATVSKPFLVLITLYRNLYFIELRWSNEESVEWTCGNRWFHPPSNGTPVHEHEQIMFASLAVKCLPGKYGKFSLVHHIIIHRLIRVMTDDDINCCQSEYIETLPLR